MPSKVRINKREKMKPCSTRNGNYENKFKCPKCTYTTKYRDLNRHMRKHETAQFSCDLCNWPFMTRGYLEKHKEVVHGIQRTKDKKLYTCDKCNYVTSHSSDKTRHRRRHELATMTCRFCNRPFFNEANLARHEKQEHNNTDNDTPEVKKQQTPQDKVKQLCYSKGIGNLNKSSIDERTTEHPLDINAKGKHRSRINKRKTGSLKEKAETFVEISDEEMDIDDIDQDASDMQGCIKSSVNINNNHVLNGRSMQMGGKSKKGKENVEKNFNTYICETTRIALQKLIEKSEQQKNINKSKDRSCPGDQKKITKTHKDRKEAQEGVNKELLMNCAFCEFNAVNLRELQEHLDSHDYDICIPDDNDSYYFSNEPVEPFPLSKSSVVLDSNDNMYHLRHEGLQTESDDGDEYFDDAREIDAQRRENLHADPDVVNMNKDNDADDLDEDIQNMEYDVNVQREDKQYKLDGCAEHLVESRDDASEHSSSSSRNSSMSMKDDDPVENISDDECLSMPPSVRESGVSASEMSESEESVANIDTTSKHTDDTGHNFSTIKTYNSSAKTEQTKRSIEGVDKVLGNFEALGKPVYMRKIKSCRKLNEALDYQSPIGGCVTPRDTISIHEFRQAPFACSRCLFKTGNLEHLTIHVEAHLYERRRSLLDDHRQNSCISDTVVSDPILIASRAGQTMTSSAIPESFVISDDSRFIDKDTDTDTTLTNRVNPLSVDEDVDVDDANYTSEDSNAGTEDGGVTNHPETSLTGRLKKDIFKRRSKCYTRHSHSDSVLYECLICEVETEFKSKDELKDHFRQRHQRLREKICSSCTYCSKPFP